MVSDPIGDLLTRIRNAYMARIGELKIPYSSIKADILKILKKNKYISEFSISEEENNKKYLLVGLNDVRVTKYVPSFRRVSKPWRRIYLWAKDIKKSKNGQGIFIVSTPKGVVTGYEARSLNVGWELLCEVF